MTRTYKGYKATLFNYMPSRGNLSKPYQAGRTYRMKSVPAICCRGYHFCRRLLQCFGYYDASYEVRVFAVVSTGAVDFGDDKMCTNKIKLVRELSSAEIVDKLSWHRPESSVLDGLVYSLWMGGDMHPGPEKYARRDGFARALLDNRQRSSIKAAMKYAGFDETDLQSMLVDTEKEKARPQEAQEGSQIDAPDGKENEHFKAL